MIYMAAGNSRRFGASNKLLAELEGRPLYQHGLLKLCKLIDQASNFNLSLTVVTQSDEILEQLTEREAGGKLPEGRAQVIVNPDSAKGASYTIRAGIMAADKIFGPADWYLFVVADQPYLREETLQAILLACAEVENEKEKENTIIRAAFQGKAGNPICFPKSLLPELLSLTGDEGGRKVAEAHFCHFVEMQSREERYDIDSMQDYLRYS